ncbi:hypothetical protein KAH55_11025 [bacterium]|nr:hypothetical protein [bacterium]
MKNRDIVRITILGTAVCMIFSLYFLNVANFNLHQIWVYFIVLGMAGSATLALLLASRFRDAFFINILIYILFVVVAYGVVKKPMMAIILLLYMIALLTAVFIYVREFEAQLMTARLSRPLVLAGLVGIFFLLATLIHGLLYIHKINCGFVLTNMPIGFFLGLGIGIGRELKKRYWTGTA